LRRLRRQAMQGADQRWPCCAHFNSSEQSRVGVRPFADILCASRGHRVPAAARVPRTGLRPVLLLYLATAGTQRPRQPPAVARQDRNPMRHRSGTVGHSAQRGRGGGPANGRAGGHEHSRVPRRPDLAPLPARERPQSAASSLITRDPRSGSGPAVCETVVHPSSASSGATACSSACSVNENSAPPPGASPASNTPWWASRIERQIASPMPMPSALVE